LFYSCLNGQVLPFTKYTSRDGLIADRITTIAQDEQGFMWFGSYFGICRYDGIKFEKIELPAKQQYKFVNHILAAKGKVYAGFLFGGGLLEYHKGKVSSYFINEFPHSNDFIYLCDNGDEGILAANTNNQVFQFRNGKFNLVFQLPNAGHSSIYCMLKDQDNNLFIGTQKGLFVVGSKKEVSLLHAGKNIFSLAKDRDGRIWMAVHQDAQTEIIVFNGWSSKGLINQQKIGEVAGTRITPFAGNLQNGFWMVSMQQGLTHVSSAQIRQFSRQLDLETDINYIFCDRENNLWVANEPGVLKISDFHTMSYMYEELAPAAGFIIRQDSIMLATNAKYMYGINAGAMQKIVEIRSPGEGYFGNFFIDRKKNLWIGLWDKGALRTKWVNGKLVEKESFHYYNGIEVKLLGAAEDSRGNFWMAGSNGIFHLRNGKIKGHYRPRNKDGTDAVLVGFAVDTIKKEMWLADNTTGVICIKYNLQKDGSCSYSETGYLHTENGLTDHFTRSICLDQQNLLWVGTRSGGIFKVNTNAAVLKAENMTAKAGLTCSRITQIVESKSSLWFATCNGIYRFNKNDQQWRHYNTSDGLIAAEVFSVYVEEEKGAIWVACAEGITQLKLQPATVAPPPLVSIIGVTVLGKTDSTALFENGAPEYRYTENSIGFSFAAASYIDEKNISYKYRLAGYEETWSDPVRTNNVHFASLPPGKYTFEVLASNARGIWSIQPARYSFKVVQPLYQRPWFIFLAVILILIMVYFVRTQRLNQKYKIEKIRLNIARDLHDDIGSGLGSINLMSETAIRKIDKSATPQEMGPVFQKIGLSAQNILESMDDIVWAINPDKDSVEDLVIRMREFAIPLLEAKGIQFDFTVNAEESKKLSMNLRRNVFLVFKEVVYNALKHAGATKIEISMYSRFSDFSLRIKDNGKGFDVNKESNRNGLKNLYKRAELLEGQLMIHSSIDGTSIIFTCQIR
jgi:signal transduction histidine kinase/ligand-binding sensor domain-containing protein